MCECKLILEHDTNEPINVNSDRYKFILYTESGEFILLEDFKLNGFVNYASVNKIKDSHGVKTGYMFIIGEKK